MYKIPSNYKVQMQQQWKMAQLQLAVKQKLNALFCLYNMYQ